MAKCSLPHGRGSLSQTKILSANGSKSRCWGHRGFSLIELIVVMLIISISAVIAAPRYAHAMQNYRADAAARQIAHQLDFARRHARATGSSVIVNLDTATHQLLLLDSGGLALSNIQLDEAPFEATLESVAIAGGVPLTFDGYGKPNVAAMIKISVGDVGRTIVLDADTGKAQVQ